MQKRSFLISFLGVFLVFGTLLAHAIFQAFYRDSLRPRVISCLLYKGDPKELIKQVQRESQFVDRFIILQSNENKPLLVDIKSALQTKRNKEISFVTLQLSSEQEKDSQEIFSKIDQLKLFKKCQNRDVILFANQGQRVNYQNLYKSLETISLDVSHTYQIDCENLLEGKIQAGAYGALKKMEHPIKSIFDNLKDSPFFKRSFFFQTQPVGKRNQDT